jgi:hypothetical protein
MLAGWRCPLFNGTTYSQVEVARPNGKGYVMEFYECAACSVILAARRSAPFGISARDSTPRRRAFRKNGVT